MDEPDTDTDADANAAADSEADAEDEVADDDEQEDDDDVDDDVDVVDDVDLEHDDVEVDVAIDDADDAAAAVVFDFFLSGLPVVEVRLIDVADDDEEGDEDFALGDDAVFVVD